MSKVVANGNGGGGTTTMDTNNGMKRMQGIVMLILFLSSAFFYKVAMQTQHNYNQHVVVPATSAIVGLEDNNSGGVTTSIKTKKTKNKNGNAGTTTTGTQGGVSHVELKTSIRKRNDIADAKCQQICTSKRNVRIEQQYNGYDILNNQQLLHIVETSINHMISTRLKSNDFYGEEYFEKIFKINMNDYTSTDGDDNEKEIKSKKNEIYPYTSSNGYKRSYRGVIPVKEIFPLQPSSIENPNSANTESDGGDDGASVDGKNDPYLLFKRKLLIKVLQVQTSIRKEESNYMGCDCLHGDKAILSTTDSDSSSATDTTTVHINATQTLYSKFVWAAGGHSASAGHGNLYNESYTAYLDYFVSPILKSIGIEFVPRNYAMGGTPSGLEISMCSKEVFGEDVDMLGWDYGMTDSKKEISILHYMYRAALLSKMPAMLGFSTYTPARIGIMKSLNRIGVPTFRMDLEERKLMNENVPDTGEGVAEDVVASVPPFIRHYKCDDAIEGHEPCQEKKYSLDLCPTRKGRTSWHAGWRDNAVQGNAVGLFIVDLLLDAIREYATTTSSSTTTGGDSANDPEVMLAELLSEENLHYKEFVDSPLPPRSITMVEVKGEPVIKEDIDIEMFFRAPNICKTGRTPSQTRYLGYLTDTDKVGGIALAKDETFDLGITKEVADSTDANGVMRLVQGPHENTCKEAINMPDYKDFFYAHAKDGWVKLTTPNNAEKKAYNYNPASVKGVIVIFEGNCDWGRCAKGDLKVVDDFSEGKWEMKVNGKSVSSFSRFGGWSAGWILKHEGGVHFLPNSEGVFDVEVNVKEPESFLRLSSIVLY